MKTYTLAEDVTTTGVKRTATQILDGSKSANQRTLQATGATTAGAGAVTVAIEVSNDGVGWIGVGTISLVLSTTDATDGFTMDAPWAQMRAKVTAISGTGAAVTVTMGI